MKYITGEKVPYIPEKTAITLGKFDGLHRGHQQLFQKVRDLGAVEGCKSVVFTFEKPPNQFFSGIKAKSIHTNFERKNYLEAYGMDYLVEYPFTSETSQMEPEAFVKDILLEKLHAAYIVVGEDFRFGYQRKGDWMLLDKLSGLYEFQLIVMSKEKYENREISSSYVREELATGNIEKANELLGYPFKISGTVIHGNKIGRTIGMPTINLIAEEEKLLPPNGVYISRTRVQNKLYKGITNIGKKPTIDGRQPLGVETYLFDWRGDLYGMEVEVELLHFKRPEQKFGTLEDLKHQIQKDVIFGKKYRQNNL